MLRPQQKKKEGSKIGNTNRKPRKSRQKERLDAWKSGVASREMSLLYACGRYNNDTRAESAVAV